MARIKMANNNLSRKDIIIDKAASLFKEKGFKATSMREIADVVGVEAASLYNHIKSKNELLNIICFEVANRYVQQMDEIENMKMSSLQKVELLLRYHINGMIQHFDEVYVSDREWKHLDAPFLNNMQNQRRTYRKRFAAIIDEGIKKKEIKKIDAPTAVLIMLHAISGIESWHRSTKKISGKELQENMVAILIDGLKKSK
ncbi:MAG: TetR/AcrR family transcriptional regulator [Chitinophagaceae bacterium]|nr:TetR/AcrR family transcriptional regulator [Chitinophagaceae bacterium]